MPGLVLLVVAEFAVALEREEEWEQRGGRSVRREWQRAVDGVVGAVG